jgi:hypothetical protein
MAIGLARRNDGDLFQNPNGHKLVFKRLDMYPQNSLAFSSLKEKDGILSKILQENNNITWTNNSSANMLCFGLAYFDDYDTSNGVTFGRHFEKKNETGFVINWPGTKLNGYRLNIGSGRKETAGYNPADVFGENTHFASLDEMMGHLETALVDKQALLAALKDIYMGRLPAIVKGGGKDLAALRDYAGEIAHPIALGSGLVSGNIDNARCRYLLNTPWNNCSIRWPTGKNSELYDSELSISDQHYLGISSKGGKGADPSVKNIWNNFTKHPQLKTQHCLAWEVVDVIYSNTAKDSPVTLSKIFNLHDSAFLDELSHVIKTESNYDLIDPIKSAYTREIMSRHDAETNNKNYNISLHLLSNIAKDVAIFLNNSEEFCHGVTESLRDLPMIQIYTKAVKNGDDMHFVGFEGLTPETFDGKIQLNAGKHYSSTALKGKYAFTWNRKKQG